ncbi:GON-4-like protein isoform X3 [Monodelphis domestica]|uniref:GON-4-like protein isoform X3 n=1 Tax=Monodelphis domestica TaxID=13616 RepID=UPI0024E23393|nr:GON-4-like protein isoform X3 [Monodelphis domestica]
MLPCKKRRTTLLSSPQHKDSQDETHFDLESTTNPEPDQVTDLGTVSLPWGLSHVRTPGLDVQPMQDVGEHICKEDPSASRLLAQDPDIAILKAIDVSNTQEINLPSLESSQPCNIHITKGKIQGTCMRRGKRTALRPGPAPRDDHPNLKESSPSAEACEKINNESGKLQMQSEEEGPLQQLGCHSARLGMQPKKSSQPAVYASPPEKAARTPPTHQNEDDMEDIGLFIPLEQDGEESEKRRRKKKGTKRKRDGRSQEEGALAYDLKLDDMLDRTLEDGAKQHNLTVVNVRNILHEVITNEHVVAMMKAAISETDDAPVFEPKMTRSKLKEVVEKGVVIPTWNISPIKKANEIKPPQFVDIHLEEDDSSDEEYQPEDEEEDETAEESLLESDVESTASSPRGSKRSRMRQSSDMIETNEEVGILSEAEKIITPPIRHINAEFVPMGPPPPPKPKQNKDSTFMEKLHAVDEELACSPVCMDSLQPLDDSLIAFRTRSKMPLKDVPLGQLEAELKAPDITPDMYDPNTADDEDWKMWLGGLMNDDVENEDEADDDDDPEYNFLEDLDEPDTEDFRNDRAVRITKKEVNELMEELFEPFQDEMGFSTIEDKGPKKEDSVTESRPSFNTPQALRFEEPLANLLNEQHRTVKELLEQLRMKKSSTKQQPEAERPKPQSDKAQQTLILDASQRKRLQQQMQQHVQLLTQIYLLSSANPSLSSEANTTKMFLRELGTFAQSSVVLHHQFNPKFQTMFQPCNLKGAMQLIEDFHSHIHIDWSPRKNVKKSASEFPCLPKQVAWILATSKVFMYPELLPICSLKAKNPRDKIFFTKAEDNLLALGLKHFEGTEFPKPLISKYLLTAKSAHQLTVRIKNLNINRAPDNIIKYYKKTKQLPILFKCCEDLQPDQWKPPVEREERHLPFWLKASLPSIQEELQHLANDAGESGNSSEVAEPSSELGLEKGSLESRNENRYPLLLPKGVVLTLKPLAKRFSRRAWRQRRSSVLKPLLIRPSPSLQPGSNTGRTPTRITQSEAPPSKVVVRIPRLIQPATVLQSVPGAPPLGVTGGDSFELPVALPPVAPENGTCLPPAMSQTLLSPAPAAFQPKVMLPALVTSKPRKTGTKWGPPKREQTKASPLLKAAPILRPAPVILTVPATTVKVVSLSNGCNMIQPLGATVAQSPQTIPITTLLVSPTSFPCPLNQPLVASSIPPLIVSGNPVSLPVPPTSEDNTQVKSDIPCPLAEGKSTFPATEPKMEPQELSTLCSALSPKEENSPVPPTPSKATSQEGSLEGNAHSWTVVKTMEGREVLEPLPRTSWETITFLPGDLVEIVKVEPEDPGEEVKLPRNKSPEQNICGEIKEEVSVELDTGPAGEGANSTQEVKKEAILQEEERGETAEISSIPHETQGEGSTKGEVSKGSPKNNSSPTNPAALSSPLGKPEDSSSVDGQSVGTPAGPEAGGEKDGPEEEEEEDFDDLTQDEEDEEMSSASEESVLSVPELQETMEKLTWLASERRMSQEGDSEEENSQEENSEPEEEEEEEVSEGMENLQKEDEMMDETAGGPTEKPPSTFASPKVTPEVETSRIPSGESTKAVGKARGSHRTRSKRGRTRASKDTSKLLLLYDEDILERDPLREQKDLAFAQAYLTRVREALCHVPGKYEDFLRVIYEFESSTQKRTAVDLYNSLQTLLHEWPQLLKDFAAFLLPEQALACGLFEEQQAFEKSRKFLRQLEICFAENPSHHQKIIKVLQGCADCLPQEITELKTQMWQLLKGHDHLQDEFSVFFDHLRPVASRLGDFEEINWTEEKEYEETEWPDGPKDCVCSCHEGNPDPKLKKNRRRGCSHCSSSKVCDNKVYKNKEPHELLGASPPPEASLTPESKEAGRGRETGDEEALDERDSRASRAARKGEMPIPGLEMGSTLLPPGEGNPTDRAPLDVPAPCSPESPQRSPKAGLVPNSIRSQAEAEGVHSPPPKLQTLSEAQQARATSDSGKTSAASGCPAFSLSPVPSNTKDIGKGQAPGQAKPDTQNSWLHPGRKFDRIPTASRIPTVLESPPPVTTTSGATHRVPVGGSSKEESSQHIRVPDGEQQLKASEATVCANNSKVSSTGEKVVLWTREADRVILTMCQERGAQPQTFSTISQQLGNKTPGEVSHRFRELMQLFHTACEGSSEDEDDATSTSNTDQLSDRGDLLSEEEPDE